MPKDCVEQTGIVTHTILIETVLFRIVKYILPPGANELKRNITRMHSARTNECTHNPNSIHIPNAQQLAVMREKIQE